MSNTISISILGDVKDISRKLGNVDKQLGGFGKSMKGLGVVAAGAFAAIGGARVFKDIVSGASDAQQSLGATETVFGDFAKTVTKQSDKAATAYGLSANEYRENANLIGSLFKNQGVAMSELGGKTDTMIAKASDLAATFGGDTATAVQALGSAFKGEFDSLEKYGISLKQSTVNAEAMRIANVDSATEWNNLSDAQKAAATQQATTNLINKQSADSAGAFAKESGTLAHQQQVLAAKVQNLKDRIGTFLLPILTKVASYVSDTVLPKFEKFGDWFENKALPVIKEYAQKFADVLVPALEKAGDFITGTLVPGFQDLVTWIQENRAWIDPLVVAVVAMVAAWKTFTTVMAIWSAITKLAAAAQVALNIAMSLNPIGIIILAIVGLIAAIVYLWKTNETFRNVIKKVWSAVKGFVLGVIDWFKTDVPKAWTTVKNKTVAIFTSVKNWIVNTWNSIKDRVVSIVTNFINGVKAKWDYFKQLNITAFNIIKDRIKAIWDGIKRAVVNAVTNVVNTAKGIKDKVVSFFSGAGKWLWNAGRNIIQGLIDGVGNMIQSLKNKFSSITNLIPDWKGPAEKDARLLYNAGELIMGGLIKGIDDQTGKLKGTLGDVTSLIQGTDVGNVGGGNLAVALAGSGRGLGGSQRPVNINVTAPDPQTAAQYVYEGIKEYERQNGSGWRK